MIAQNRHDLSTLSSRLAPQLLHQAIDSSCMGAAVNDVASLDQDVGTPNPVIPIVDNACAAENPLRIVDVYVVYQQICMTSCSSPRLYLPPCRSPTATSL